MATDYVVVTGTTGAVATFQTAVEAYLAQGYTVSGGCQVDGGNIYQSVVKEQASVVPAFAINAVVTGATGSFRVATDQRQYFPVGYKFKVVGSTGNDGTWTVKSPGATYGGGNTTIPVIETVPDATVDGSVSPTT
jgi:hypothetical protein